MSDAVTYILFNFFRPTGACSLCHGFSWARLSINLSTPRPFSGSCVCSGSLTAYGKASSVTQPPVAAKIHQSFYVCHDLAAQITFNPITFVNNCSQLLQFVVGKFFGLAVKVDSRMSQNFSR